MSRTGSITRRLLAAVLLLELLAAVALISAITYHERRIQLKSLDAMLTGTADSIMGAVQDAEDAGDNVMLDMQGMQLPRGSIYRVVDDRGHVLGSLGAAPEFGGDAGAIYTLRNFTIDGRGYRFVQFRGVRVIDPGTPAGGVRHDVTVLYGIPTGHMWHEVIEAVRFFGIATLILLGATSALMVWMIRRSLSPLNDLAREAERIDPHDWTFSAPASAKGTVELRPLATALEAALARLHRSFQQQRRFTNDAAHELKTDVAIVKSSLQLLSMRKRTVEEYGLGLALSLDDFARLETTVQKMLALARLEQAEERDSQATEGCSFREAVEEAVHQSAPLAELRSIKVHIDAKEDSDIHVDRRDAVLLCSNILLNALQHGPDGSNVWMILRTMERIAQLTVRDQGEGVATEDLPHLFDPFYRGDPSRSRKTGGTGLGLSICRAICERAGGLIEICNHPEGGAIVTVQFPVDKPMTESAYSGSLKADAPN